jgi:iron complex outermembrane receptor protein
MGITHTLLFAAIAAALAGAAPAPLHAAGAGRTAGGDGASAAGPRRTSGAMPRISLDDEAIRATGASSLDEVLQRLPSVYIERSARINSAPFGSNRNDGSASVGMHKLGAARTLVLVNGRRQVGNGIDGGVDLNAIPIAAVQRIDVYSGGDSARFGDGAIAGVIDIRLVAGYSGAGMSAQWGEFTEGDGRRQKYDALVGFEGERGNVTIGAGFVKDDPIWAGDRDISAVPTFGLPATDVNYGGASGIGPRVRLLTALGQLVLIPGRPGTSPSDFRPFDSAVDGYNFAPDNYLQTPQERSSFFMDGRYEVLEGVEFYTQATFNERLSEQRLSAFPGSGGGFNTNPNFNTIRVPANNLYNPLGVEIQGFGRRWVEGGGRSYTQDVDNYSFVGGLQGDFLLADNVFAWDLGYHYAREERVDQTFGLQNALNLRNALGPGFIDATGTPRCGSVPVAIPGCVPLNIFGDVGSVTPAMLDYIGFVEQGLRGSDLSNYWARISGDLFELVEGRPATLSGGYEYRRESAFDQPDAFTNAGLSSGSFRPPTDGGYSSDEFHLQLTAPLLAGLPAVHLLELQLGGRHADYSSVGDADALAAGLAWQPIESLTLRGSWSEGYRVPSVAELYQGPLDTFPSLLDPCSEPRFSALPPEIQQRCIDDGVTPGYTSLSSQIRVAVGGNPFLTPELSDSRTLGIHFAPQWLEGVNVSLDWQRITIDDVIAARDIQFIVTACYFDPDPAVRDRYCRMFDRAPGGVPRDMTAGPVNVAERHSEHWDLNIDYAASFRFGDVVMNWLSTYSSENRLDEPNYNTLQPLDPVVWRREDRTGQEWGDDMYPRLRSLLRLAWRSGDFGVDWAMRYTHHVTEDCSFFTGIEAALGIANPCSDPQRDTPAFPGGANHIGSHTLHDLRLRWTAPWRAELALGIDNLFDKQPPVSYTAFANSYNVGQFQPPGRSWFVQYRQHW